MKSWRRIAWACVLAWGSGCGDSATAPQAVSGHFRGRDATDNLNVAVSLTENGGTLQGFVWFGPRVGGPILYDVSGTAGVGERELLARIWPVQGGNPFRMTVRRTTRGLDLVIYAADGVTRSLEATLSPSDPNPTGRFRYVLTGAVTASDSGAAAFLPDLADSSQWSLSMRGRASGLGLAATLSFGPLPRGAATLTIGKEDSGANAWGGVSTLLDSYRSIGGTVEIISRTPLHFEGTFQMRAVHPVRPDTVVIAGQFSAICNLQKC
jgi:hypothetical protein